MSLPPSAQRSRFDAGRSNRYTAAIVRRNDPSRRPRSAILGRIGSRGIYEATRIVSFFVVAIGMGRSPTL